jgi:hypothetical protein
MLMLRTATLYVLAVLVLVGCSGDPYARYIGLWQLQDSPWPKVLEITKDGDTYLADENVLSTKDIFGNVKKPMVLKKSEGQLSVDTGLGSAELGLSEDENTLHAMDREYKRITSGELQTIQAKIEQDRVEAEKNKELCKTMNDDYVKEKSKLTAMYRDLSERTKQQRELGQKFLAKAKEIPSCALQAWIGF